MVNALSGMGPAIRRDDTIYIIAYDIHVYIVLQQRVEGGDQPYIYRCVIYSISFTQTK